MPFAGLAFGLGTFAAIGLPGFANFAGEIMIFFGAFKNGWEMGASYFPNRDRACALGRGDLDGLYAARLSQDVHGNPSERWTKGCCDLQPGLRVPVTLLVRHCFAPDFFRNLLCESWRRLRTISPRRHVRRRGYDSHALCAVSRACRRYDAR